jgi:hypothetical protein
MYMSRSSTVGIVNGYGLDDRQVSSETHPASYTVGTGALTSN